MAELSRVLVMVCKAMKWLACGQAGGAVGQDREALHRFRRLKLRPQALLDLGRHVLPLEHWRAGVGAPQLARVLHSHSLDQLGEELENLAPRRGMFPGWRSPSKAPEGKIEAIHDLNGGLM